MTDVRDMVLVHRVFRREFRLIPGMVQAVGTADVARHRAVCQHAVEMLDALHHHHEGEDELLWPRLMTRAPEAAALAREMISEHEAVGAAMRRSRASLQTWSRPGSDGKELADELSTVHGSLCAHLDREEAEVLPLVGDNISEEEWAELADRGFGAMPKSRALVFLGHILEEADEDERTRFLHKVPPPVRLLFKVRGRHVHSRETAYLRSSVPLPR